MFCVTTYTKTYRHTSQGAGLFLAIYCQTQQDGGKGSGGIHDNRLVAGAPLAAPAEGY